MQFATILRSITIREPAKRQGYRPEIYSLRSGGLKEDLVDLRTQCSNFWLGKKVDLLFG